MPSIMENETPLEKGEKLSLHMIKAALETGITYQEAEFILERGANLAARDRETGFSVFHAAAAAGRKDLFDLFAEYAEPAFSDRDARGRTPADLAAMIAQNYDLSFYISELEADILDDHRPK